MKTRHSLFALIAILLLGITLRWYAIPAYPVISTDSCEFLVSGKNLISGNGFTSINGYADTTFAPLFPIAVGLAHLLIKDLEYAGIFTTLFFGCLIVPATYLFAWRLFRHQGIALGAALLMACHPRMVELSIAVATEALYIFLLLVAMTVFVVALRKGRLFLFITSGGLLGLVCLTRAIGFFYLFIFFAGILTKALLDRERKIYWLHLMAVAGTFIVVVFPYLLFVHAHTGQWSLSPEAGGWWGMHLGDIEKMVYGNEPGSMSNPIYTGVLSAWYHRPDLFLKLVIVNARNLFINHFAILFPPWILVPASLGFFCSSPYRVRTNLFLAAMFLPVGIQFLHLFSYRYVFPVIPLVALWVPEGIGVMARWLQKCGEEIRIFSTSKSREGWINRLIWTGLICLLILTTLRQVLVPGDLPVEHKRAGLWLKEQWGKGKIIMSRKPWVSFYAEGIWHAIPYSSMDKVVAEAKKLEVEFLVIDERCIPTTRPQLTYLLSEGSSMPGLQRVYQEDSLKKILIYRFIPSTGEKSSLPKSGG